MSGDSMADWTAVIALDALWDEDPVVVTVDGIEVLLVRSGEDLFAVARHCTHQGAPLDRGRIDLAGSLKTVVCPAHGSRFDLATGRVLRTPATTPLPTYETRVEAGMVELRPRES